MQSLKVKNLVKAEPAGEDAFLSDKGQLGNQQAEIPTAAYKVKTCFASKNEIPHSNNGPVLLFETRLSVRVVMDGKELDVCIET